MVIHYLQLKTLSSLWLSYSSNRILISHCLLWYFSNILFIFSSRPQNIKILKLKETLEIILRDFLTLQLRKLSFRVFEWLTQDQTVGSTIFCALSNFLCFFAHNESKTLETKTSIRHPDSFKDQYGNFYYHSLDPL